MELFTTTQVETKKCYDVIPTYTSEEKKMMGDIPMYNFDTIIDYTPGVPNPKILFSTSYDHNEDYRSMFALTENQIHGLINLLQTSLSTLQAKKEEQETLNATIKEFGNHLCDALRENELYDYKVIFKELCGKSKNLKTFNGDTTFISLRIKNKNSSKDFYTSIRLAINVDKEILSAIDLNKAKTTNNRIDKVKESLIHVIKTKFIGLVVYAAIKDKESKLSNDEFNKICQNIYNTIPFEFEFDDSDEGKIKSLIKKNEEESKKIIEDLDSVMKSPKDLGPTLIQLSKPTPIKPMSNEEAKKISEEFMKEYKNKK